jgi:hypothetical protein
MIEANAKTGSLSDKHALAQALAAAAMRWEEVPPISCFRDNTAAFIHNLPAEATSNVTSDSNNVRVQFSHR